MPDDKTSHDAYTRVFHELLEPLLRVPKINGTQFRIIFWVARNSYGRRGAQFAACTWGSIARGIAAPSQEPARVRVSREGRALLKRGILRLGAEGEIGINKHRIIELGGDAKTHPPCENAPCAGASPSVPNSHPLSYNKEKRKYTVAEPNGFDSFWQAYPKRVGKGAARRSWAKLRPDLELQAIILAAVAAQRTSDQWCKEDGRYIPNPATWLNQERWADEVAAPPGRDSRALDERTQAWQQELEARA
jgi:hypothetical protein